MGDTPASHYVDGRLRTLAALVDSSPVHTRVEFWKSLKRAQRARGRGVIAPSRTSPAGVPEAGAMDEPGRTPTTPTPNANSGANANHANSDVPADAIDESRGEETPGGGDVARAVHKPLDGVRDVGVESPAREAGDAEGDAVRVGTPAAAGAAIAGEATANARQLTEGETSSGDEEMSNVSGTSSGSDDLGGEYA